ncbi:hypothetical protein ABID42_002630 [Arcicella rosea]
MSIVPIATTQVFDINRSLIPEKSQAFLMLNRGGDGEFQIVFLLILKNENSNNQI